MKQIKLFYRWEWVLLILVLALGFGLRWHKYAEYPIAGETKDEWYFTWVGESLWSGQTPTGWSWFSAYPQTELTTVGGDQFRIVSPTFDHPPLFSLIPGLAAKMTGYHGITLPSIKVIRFPMLLIGTLNLGLLYWLSRSWYGKRIALLLTLLYATIPFFVFSSRLVVAENLLISLLLAALLAATAYLKNRDGRWLWVLGIIAGLALLVKVSGIMIVVFGWLLLLKEKHYRGLAAVTLPFVAAVAAWVGYAALFDLGLFLKIQLTQSGLAVGGGSLLNLFLRPLIAEKAYFDGWYYLGLLALFGVWLMPLKAAVQPAGNLIRLMFLAWFLFFFTAVGEQTWHGWYRYPLFPLMILGFGLIARLRHLPALLPALLLTGLVNLRLLTMTNLWVMPSLLWRLFIAGAVGICLYLWWQPERTQKIRPVIIGSLIVLVVALNAALVIGVNADRITEDYMYFFPTLTLK